jgi:hypothetical protein
VLLAALRDWDHLQRRRASTEALCQRSVVRASQHTHRQNCPAAPPGCQHLARSYRGTHRGPGARECGSRA